MGMILHLIGNDPKFPILIRERFEAAKPSIHVYVIVKTNPNQPENAGEGFQYVATPSELASIVESRTDWQAIIINGMLSRLVSFCDVFPVGCPVAYYIWGGEAYRGILHHPCQQYLPKTLDALFSPAKKIKFFISSLCGAQAKLRRECHAVAQHIDIAIFSLEEEVDHFVYHGLLPESVQFVQGRVGQPLNFDAKRGAGQMSPGDDILVGNSADPSNNHLDVFEWLSQGSRSEGQRIVVPLSYGGSEAYIEAVINSGKVLFGQCFHPILNFMPYERYLDIIGSCGFLVMGHLRQQGYGNILMALSTGVTVYLQPSTTVFKGLKRQGAIVKEIGVNSQRLEKISEIERMQNIDVCHEHYGYKQSVELTSVLLEKLEV